MTLLLPTAHSGFLGARAGAPAAARRLAARTLVGLLGTAGIALGACDMPRDEDAQASPQERKAAYSASCAGRVDCVATDTLVVTPPKSGALPLVCAWLRFGERGAARVALFVPFPADKTALPLTVPLLPLLRSAVERERVVKGEKSPVTEALRAAPAARLDVQVVWQDQKDGFGSQTLSLDVGPLWGQRLLTLQVDKANCNGGACRFGNRIDLSVPALSAWAIGTGKDPGKLSLVLGDLKLPGLAVTYGPWRSGLSFALARDGSKPDIVTAWNAVLPALLAADANSQGLAVGLADEQTAVSLESVPAAARLHFEAWGASGILALIAGAIAIIGGGLYCVGGLSVIRDTPPELAFRDKMPFSLGRSQMLLWTFAVAGAWIFIGWTVGDWTGPNPTALTLMGIGLATGLGSVSTSPAPIIGAQQQTDLQAYEAALAKLRDNKADAAALSDREAKRAALQRAGVFTRGWFVDVVTDVGSSDTGFHRVQSLLFTGLLFGGFLYQVWQTRAMPVFPDAQLGLLGISSGAYIGFKLANRP